MGCYSIFKVVVAIGTLLGKGNYKITDRYSANGVGVVLYYHIPYWIYLDVILKALTGLFKC
jgi:hypothetical protein